MTASTAGRMPEKNSRSASFVAVILLSPEHSSTFSYHRYAGFYFTVVN